MTAPQATPDSAIQLLPEEVIDQIAAGEVIERPASVAKELIENAVDAGATAVSVDIEGGGLARLSVSDDGSGMSATDARLSLLRHATSKLRCAEDLFAIHTLGFRGEALCSIAAVSRLTLTTRRRHDAAGVRVRVEGGVIREVEEAGCAVGTTIDVRDLFFNTPARKAFMRSPATEQAHIVEAAVRVVLGARRGGIVVQSGARRLLDLSEEASAEQRVAEALGHRAAELYPFAGEHEGVRVSGSLAPPGVDRGDARGLWFFVNGRFVRDRLLQRAVADAFRTLLERGRYPLAVLHIDLDPAAVDINVHPQKLEVRFRDSALVFRAVSKQLTVVLQASPWVATDRRASVTAALQRSYEAAGARTAGERQLAYTPWPSGAPASSGPERDVAAAVEPLFAAGGGYFSKLRPVGQLLGVYLVCEGPDEMVLIDQHAAHERVAFERLRRQAEAGAIARQPLLFPEVLEAPARQGLLLEERAPWLLEYGFEIEPVGPGRFAVRAVPVALDGADAVRLAQDLLDELVVVEDAGPSLAAAEARARVLSRCACHAAVRAGDALSTTEIAALLAALDDVDFGAYCPHGRPVHRVFPRLELARGFHRG